MESIGNNICAQLKVLKIKYESRTNKKKWLSCNYWAGEKPFKSKVVNIIIIIIIIGPMNVCGRKYAAQLSTEPDPSTYMLKAKYIWTTSFKFVLFHLEPSVLAV